MKFDTLEKRQKDLKIKNSKIDKVIIPKKPFTREGYIYFIYCNGFVKIGKAKRPIARMASMQVGNPYELILMAFIKVDNYIHYEDSFHNLFSEYWVRGEWYNIKGRFLKFLVDLGVIFVKKGTNVSVIPVESVLNVSESWFVKYMEINDLSQ